MTDTPEQTPRWTPSARELDDLDLLLHGVLPVDGFVDPSSAGNAAPITLVVDVEGAELALGYGELDLMDPEGVPLGRLDIQDTWDAGDDRTGLTGPVTRLADNDFGPFRRLHRSPSDVHAEHPRESLVAVAVRRPLTEADLDLVRAAADGRTVVLVACVGDGMPERMSGPALVRTCLAAADELDDAVVVASSVADHGWEARHHSYDSPNAWLLETVAQAYADTVVTLEPEGSGDMPAAVAEITATERPPRHEQGVVVFFTGLSGSGKSTLARALIDHVLEKGDRSITSLDGDVVRHHLSKGLGFSRADRETNILRIGFVASEIARHGGMAICSPIAPFTATRAAVKEMVERAGGGFVLIHVATPLEECERRDRKGLYAKARAGEIPDFTGISSPYETPTEAIKVDTTNKDIAECLRELVDVLTDEGWLLP